MMGLTPVPLVCIILLVFLCILTILLVVLVTWGLAFLPTEVDSKYDIFAFVVFVPIGFESKGGRLIKMFWRLNYLFSFQI